MLGRADSGTDVAEATRDDELGPDELIEVRELVELVRGCIRTLRPRDATLVSMVAYLGFTPTEVGAALGLSPSAAKVALYRSRNRLRAAVVAEVLGRRDRVGCPHVDVVGMLRSEPGALGHLGTCDRCRRAAEGHVGARPS
jgi:hypothetical protein